MSDYISPELGAVKWPDPRTDSLNLYIETITIAPADTSTTPAVPESRLRTEPGDLVAVTTLNGRRMFLNARLMLSSDPTLEDTWGRTGAVAIIAAELDAAMTEDIRRQAGRN